MACECSELIMAHISARMHVNTVQSLGEFYFHNLEQKRMHNSLLCICHAGCLASLDQHFYETINFSFLSLGLVPKLRSSTSSHTAVISSSNHLCQASAS